MKRNEGRKEKSNIFAKPLPLIIRCVNYELVLTKLKEEVKTWGFIYRKGSAKYEYEDSDSSVFFLSYCWELFIKYCKDLLVCFMAHE